METSYTGESTSRLPSYGSSTLSLDVPRPLQIIKRVRNFDQSDLDSLRKSSLVSSAVTDESLGIPFGGDPPLVIPKKRYVPQPSPHKARDGNQRLCDITADSDSDLETTPRPRRSNSCESPARAPGDFPTPTLSTKASLLFLKGKKPGRPLHKTNIGAPLGSSLAGSEFGLGYKAIQATATNVVNPTLKGTFGGYRSPSGVSSGISSANFNISVGSDVSCSATSPYLLAPRIVATPECRALDDGVTTL